MKGGNIHMNKKVIGGYIPLLLNHKIEASGGALPVSSNKKIGIKQIIPIVPMNTVSVGGEIHKALSFKRHEKKEKNIRFIF